MKYRLAVIHVGFALTGVVTTLLGPTLPLLTARWNLNDAQAGRLFTAQFVAGLLGSLAGIYLLRRVGTRWTIRLGMLVVACGVALVGSAAVPIGIAGICLYGVGLGFAIPSTNLLVAQITTENKIAALNLLNFSWTAGAVVGPLLISASRSNLGLRGFLASVSIAVLAVAAAEFFSGPPLGAVAGTSQDGKLEPANRLLFALLSFLFLLLYIGVENGFSGWLSAFSVRLHHTTASSTAIIQSSFWGMILLGRLLAPLFLRWLGQNRLMFGGLGAAAIGTVITIWAPNLLSMEVGVLMAGLGLATLFPTAAAIFTEWVGTGPMGSVVLGACGVGGAIIPALMGFVAFQTGSLRAGFWLLLITLCVASAIFWRMSKLTESQGEDTPHPLPDIPQIS